MIIKISVESRAEAQAIRDLMAVAFGPRPSSLRLAAEQDDGNVIAEVELAPTDLDVVANGETKEIDFDLRLDLRLDLRPKR